MWAFVILLYNRYPPRYWFIILLNNTDAIQSCNDGLQNNDETGIDCGGSCVACPSCNDGLQNQNELGIDCGGECAACPTCNDEIQNQDETGIDSGGFCSTCPTCNDVKRGMRFIVVWICCKR